ncbi:MAG TPA: HDIG domain-containing protein [Firmicutes bacterium]|nr:HDIG domain-containing protein [Candidatus Fermentithermobacillaceae bacterium]
MPLKEQNGGKVNRENGRKSRTAKTRLSGVAFLLDSSKSSLFWTGFTYLVVTILIYLSLRPMTLYLKEGDISPVDVRAPQEIIDEVQTEKLREERARAVSTVVDNDPKVLQDILSRLDAIRTDLESLRSTADLTTEKIVSTLRPYVGPELSNSDIVAAAATSSPSADAAIGRAKDIARQILTRGIREEDLKAAVAEVENMVKNDPAIPSSFSPFLVAYFRENLRPNLIYNQEETERRMAEARASVEPVRIRRGQIVLKAGETVTREHIALLDKLGMLGPGVRPSDVGGAVLMGALVVALPQGYLSVFVPETKRQKGASLIASVTVLTALLVRGFSAVSPYLAPVAAGVMLSATLVDRRFGVVFGFSMTLLLAVFTGFDVRYLVVFLTSSVAAVLVITRSFQRSHLMKAGAAVSAANLLSFLGLGLSGGVTQWDLKVLPDYMWLIFNGPLCAILAIGSLPFFEAVFDILTPIRLIELSNPEHPLLHRLLLEAPGTYHHSIMVGNLAEAAAQAVGADSLLTRVGSYYHDIGKVKRPYMFVENQVPGLENPHDRLNPGLSASVIIAHVKDGLELAEQARIPEDIRRFIAEHHGTTLVSYFFTKASEDAKEKENRPPAEWDFRYEGPRPSTRESAIVMLADGVEAATRALSRPTPARIESVVRKIIQDRLIDHQLDRSDLTLKDLDIIAATFTRILTGVFHTRIEYPSPDKLGVARDYPEKNGPGRDSINKDETESGGRLRESGTAGKENARDGTNESETAGDDHERRS